MSAPTPSKLDQQQILQAVHNETDGTLRVDATLIASIIEPDGLEVSISASSDNIAIRNTGNNNELLIQADGSIKTNQGLGGSSAWKVDGSAVTQPIGAVSLPLPANAAQETGGHLASIDTKLTSPLTVSLPANAAQETGGHLASIDTKLINFATTPVQTIQLFTKPFDAVTVTYPSGSQEVYVSRVGGIAGTVQQTATVNYTDTTKANLLNVSVV